MRLGLALEAGHVGLFEHDHRNETHHWSSTLRKILGHPAHSPAGIVGYLALISPDERMKVADALNEARDRESANIIDIEHPIIRADGSERWLTLQATTHFDGVPGDRKAVRTIGAVLDITDRKHLEKQLERRVSERTAELRAVLDSVPDAVVTTTTDRILRTTNATAAKLFGYSEQEFPGMPASRLYATPADEEDIAKAWPVWEQQDTKSPVVVTCRRKDGTTFPAMASGSVVRDSSGTIISRVGLIRDVTDDIKRQRALTQAQRMEAYGQLTGGVAHDFNNLLTVITGNQELLEMRLRDPKDLALLKRSQEAAEMGARLTARLLTFARRRQLEPTLLRLNEQIAGMVELLKRSIGEQVRLKTTLAPDIWAVRADASEIENAILNLAINARDAMPKGGTLAITTANRTIGVGDDALELKLPPGDYVCISVTDTGNGMTPYVLQRAMEPFFTTKGPGKGTGLGLSTIYGFVQQSGGTMTIASEAGQGTAIEIYLPRALIEAGEAATERTASSVPLARGETILVVEDNDGVREVTSKRLAELGYRVITLDTARLAIERLRSEETKVNLVFSDIVMPGGMSGYDLAGWIAEHRPHIKCLLTSGYPDEIARTQSGDLRSIRLLRKPYTRRDMAETLREILDQPLRTSPAKT